MFFLDDDLAKLGRAFDRAWDRFLQMGLLSLPKAEASGRIERLRAKLNP